MLNLDINSAFDTFWHDGIIYKLIEMNVDFYLVKIVQDFLKERKFRVHLGKTSSELFTIPAGVPQGSILGPILYNIYTSDLPRFDDVNLSIFADDTCLFTSGTYSADIKNKLQSSINILSDYFYKWKISINVDKTKAIFFTNKRKTCFIPNSNIKLYNSDILWVDTVKYLGLHLDKRLTFKEHVGKIIDKINKTTKILYPFINKKSNLSRDNKLLLMKVIFQPIILYACPVFYNMADSHILKLQTAQNKLLKLMLGLPFYYSTKKLHHQTKITLISDLINSKTNKTMDKCLNSNNVLIKNLFQLSI